VSIIKVLTFVISNYGREKPKIVGRAASVALLDFGITKILKEDF